MGAFAAKVTIFFVDTGLCAHASMFDLLGSAGATADLFSHSIGVVIISSSSALSLATHFEQWLQVKQFRLVVFGQDRAAHARARLTCLMLQMDP